MTRNPHPTVISKSPTVLFMDIVGYSRLLTNRQRVSHSGPRLKCECIRLRPQQPL